MTSEQNSSTPTVTFGPDRSAALPKAWDPSDHEAALYEAWVNDGLFHADPSSDKPGYSIILPPPNVTGHLHIGHALDHTLMDALVRRKRMQGYEVMWVPGADHAGIATQTKVEEHLKEREGKDRHDYTREGFLEEAWAFAREKESVVTSQFRGLGDSVDWERYAFTLDEQRARGVQTIFKTLYDQGLIYQANRMVNWSPVLGTALSDVEVVHKDVEGELVSIRYGSLQDDEPHVIVATTRVETMLGDVAVAVHPEDERYADLIGTELPHPFLPERSMVIVADDYVDPEFGTGAVKITPAHDPNDFALGQRHDLPMPVIMDAAGRIADTGTEFDGMDRYEAREKIRLALDEQGRIVGRKHPYVHSVGHSERSGEPIEPRLSLQWWVNVEELARMAGEGVRSGDVTIVPPAQEPRYFDWVDDMHDWCISRQLWWGHRIPVWYGPEGEAMCCGPDDTPPEGWVQDEDVLDTWFSSALWPFTCLGWPESTPELEKFYPTSVLVTGYDILFFWVARMMMMATFAGSQEGNPFPAGQDGRPQVPFRTVMLHGLVRDEFGRKMSKSLGNGIDPQEWVQTYGADATRFTLARGAHPGTDLPVGADHAQASRNFVTKLFNATKFALLNGAYVGELPASEELTDADRWILGRLADTIAVVDDAYERYEFSVANETLYHFVWDDLCDWYLEIAKVQIPREVDNASEEEVRRGSATQRVLGHVLDLTFRLLHPAMPFVTEVLWTTLTEGVEGYPTSLTFAPWPAGQVPADGSSTRANPTPDNPAEAEARRSDLSDRRIADTITLVTEIRRFRSDQDLKPSNKVPARIDFAAADLSDLEPAIRTLVRFEDPGEDFAPTASLEVRLSHGPITVDIDTSGTIDLDAEKARLEKALAEAEKELDNAAKKLSNESFVTKAPEKVVDGIRQRQAIAEEEKQRITARLADIAARQAGGAATTDAES